VVERLAGTRVIIFGLGGVGSWAAEALIRTGIGHLTMVDADRVTPTNINRQLPALSTTVGEVKVDVMHRHLLDINPQADITAIHGLYDSTTASDYDLSTYDYVIDAIDSLSDKALLILNATQAMRGTGMKFYSSMGAALKLDPSRIAVAEFWKVKGCPLAAALRRKFKKSGKLPAHKFQCVYSDELVPNSSDYTVTNAGDESMSFNKVAVNGSLMHITSIFGITLASMVIRDVTQMSRQ
ncbi:MAG: tRNA threonylcarbamoyladenosine dehydratase, partial [Duncaniella sp.]|nr:tRNA threonylcarbamoyladenosine dehydratase [Duncaniella sp.]